MIDANEIIRALKLWFQPGDVFEVRVLDAISATGCGRTRNQDTSITSTLPK